MWDHNCFRADCRRPANDNEPDQPDWRGPARTMLCANNDSKVVILDSAASGNPFCDTALVSTGKLPDVLKCFEVEAAARISLLSSISTYEFVESSTWHAVIPEGDAPRAVQAAIRDTVCNATRVAVTSPAAKPSFAADLMARMGFTPALELDKRICGGGTNRTYATTVFVRDTAVPPSEPSNDPE